MKTMVKCMIAIAAASALVALSTSAAIAEICERRYCPVVETAREAITASYVSADPGGSWSASSSAPTAHPYTYRLSSPCEFDAAAGNACRAEDDAACPAP